MTYSPATKRTSPATVIPRPKRSYPYSAHPFSPGPARVQVEETNVQAIRLAAPTTADTMGIQNFRSTWPIACFFSRFAQWGLFAKIAPGEEWCDTIGTFRSDSRAPGYSSA